MKSRSKPCNGRMQDLVPPCLWPPQIRTTSTLVQFSKSLKTWKVVFPLSCIKITESSFLLGRTSRCSSMIVNFFILFESNDRLSQWHYWSHCNRNLQAPAWKEVGWLLGCGLVIYYPNLLRPQKLISYKGHWTCLIRALPLLLVRLLLVRTKPC